MKTIVLTGGANGIGRAIVEQMADQVNLYVMDIDEEAGKRVTEKLATKNLHFFYGDLAEKSHLDDFIGFVRKQTEKIDGIIHNAAINHGGLVSQASLEDFMEVLRVNVGTAYYLTQQFEPCLSQEASIILLSSTRNHQSMPNDESYSSSKGALLSLTHAMANSLKGKARVNAISPGWIDTISDQSYEERDALSHEDLSQHLVNRVGNPLDIVHMVDYLLDAQKSGFITGQEFVVDGGMSKQMVYHGENGWVYETDAHH
ncbi:glucose 1-dehydrogenase [Alkalibacterium iburiense]|uniref:Glucose 1-dehydrogenase n=1 Tax=Alkalibacterium iburiense TaxID=290589 RepID=A0ABP3GT56_9LACT